MTRVFSTSSLHRAARVLRDGAVVAHAAEGVWGFACDPYDERAVARVRELKGRDGTKGFIVVAACAADFAALLDPLGADADPIRASWPGAVTWVVPHHDSVPRWIHGGRRTVAIRVTPHPQFAALARAFGGSLLSTSCNRSGRSALQDELRVRRTFGRDCHVLSGRTLPGYGASEIRDVHGTVLRSGGVLK